MTNTIINKGDQELLLSFIDRKGRVAIRSTEDGLVYMDGFASMNTRMGDAIRASLPEGCTPEGVDAHLTLNGGRLALSCTVDGIKGLYDLI